MESPDEKVTGDSHSFSIDSRLSEAYHAAIDYISTGLHTSRAPYLLQKNLTGLTSEHIEVPFLSIHFRAS